LPISKSTPFRALYFLKRSKSGPSKLLSARKKTNDRSDIQDFVMNQERLWTKNHSFSPLSESAEIELTVFFDKSTEIENPPAILFEKKQVFKVL